MNERPDLRTYPAIPAGAKFSYWDNRISFGKAYSPGILIVDETATIHMEATPERPPWPTSREARLTSQYKSGFYKVRAEPVGSQVFEDGELRPGVTVDGGNVMVNMGKLYVDDLLALAADFLECLHEKHPCDENQMALLHLNKALMWMDKRALRRHGYSRSAAERNFEPPYERGLTRYGVPFDQRPPERTPYEENLSA